MIILGPEEPVYRLRFRPHPLQVMLGPCGTLKSKVLFIVSDDPVHFSKVHDWISRVSGIYPFKPVVTSITDIT